MFRKILSATVLGASVLTTSAIAQSAPDPDFVSPCNGSPSWVESDADFSDFDFWLGEWQVFHKESGELRGFDDVEKVLEGCVIQQHWRQMDDLFTLPGAPFRLQGRSLTGITADGVWRQVWTDTSGSNLVFTGGYDGDGVMTLVSEWYTAPTQSGEMVRLRNFWHWDPQDDGTINNWGFVQRGDENGEKQKYFDIVYRRNAVGSAASQMRK